MMNMILLPRAVRIWAAVLLFASAAGLALAATVFPLLVSTFDPLPANCDTSGGTETEAGQRDWEAEPTLVVNPNDSKNLITAWTQDFADGIVAAYSTDGGKVWQESVVSQKFCTSTSPDLQKWGSAYDSHLAFGKNGTAYLAAILIGKDTSDTAAVISMSTDKGKTWHQTILDQALIANFDAFDWTTIATDPVRPKVAYVGWDRLSGVVSGITSGERREPYFSRTTDGGRTWSDSVAIFCRANYGVPPGFLEISNELLTEPDGALVDIFALIPAVNNPKSINGPAIIMATTSNDSGEHWSTPSQLFVESDATHYAFFASAVAPDGGVHIAWQQTNSPNIPTMTTIMHMTATPIGNGQFVTSTPSTVKTIYERPVTAAHGSLAPPLLAFRPDGTLGVLFYDHSSNKAADYPSGDLPHMTDVWVRVSRDGGLTWPDSQERHIAGPFDIGTAPDTDGFNASCAPCDVTQGGGGNALQHTYGNGFLGDYWGFIPYDGGFAMSFGRTNKQDDRPHNTDIYFSKMNLNSTTSSISSTQLLNQ